MNIARFLVLAWVLLGTGAPAAHAQPTACCMPDGSCTVVEPAACAGTTQAPGSTCTPGACMVACCTSGGACSVTTAADCADAGGRPQPYGTTCATANCPAAADYADFKSALAATAIVRYEYGASLVQRPRVLATLIALQRVAAANPNITAQQLDAFVFAYDARLRAQIPGDPDLARGINLMVAVRYPSSDLAPMPADILDGIDAEIDQAVLRDLGQDPYDTGDGNRTQQMEQFQLTPVGLLGNSSVIARSLYKLMRGQDADGGVHTGLIPAAMAYLTSQPTWDSPTADPLVEGFIGINPFPSPAELSQRYPAVASVLSTLPQTPEEFAAQAASDGLEDVAQGVLGEMAQITQFIDEKTEELRALLESGYDSLAATRAAAQNAEIVQNAINQRQVDLRTLAERRAAIDVGVLAMQSVTQLHASRPVVLQEVSVVQLQVADQTALEVGTLIFGVGQIVAGGALIYTGAGAAAGVPLMAKGFGTLLPLLGQFGGGSQEEWVRNEISQMRVQMMNFQIDMQERLDHIDAAIHASYVGLSEQLEIIQARIGQDLSEVRTQLAIHSSAMARFESNVYGMLTSGFNYNFVADANVALGYRDRFMFDMRYTDNAPSDYQSFENTFYTYAFNQSSLPPYVFGTAGATLPTLDELDFSTDNTGNPIGSRINLLRTVPGLLGVSNLGPSTVANPTSWALNADAHMQLHKENPWYTAADVGRWNQIRTKGQDAQSVMWAAKSQVLFDALFVQYTADMEALQADIENPDTLHEWAVETSCPNCDVNLWPGNPLLQAAYLRWVAFKLTSPGAHHLTVAAEEATRDIRLMDAYLAMACPGELDRNDLLRGMLRGDELGMDTAAIAQYLIDQASFLETPGAVGRMFPPSMSEVFARYTDVGGFSQHAWRFEIAGDTTYVVGGRPRSVAVGDLNGDGRPDLATANNDNRTVSVLLGLGDGTFGTSLSFSTGANGIGPQSIAMGDLNGDDRLDLATANWASHNGHNVSVLLGNGDGTFQSGITYATGGSPNCIALGDFNSDGRIDVVTANQSGSYSVLMGNGNGTLQTAQSYSYGSTPLFIAIGDLNGDDRLDLATANINGNVSVLLGNGNGTFAPNGAPYPAGSLPVCTAIGDLNGDGWLDLATANLSSNSVSTLLGNGDGTFQIGSNYGTGAVPTHVAISDLNGDGRADLVTSNRDDYTVSVRLGNGNGTFQGRLNFDVSGPPLALAVGDLNGDDVPDVVGVNDAPLYRAWALLNLSAGRGAAHLATGNSPLSVAIGDLNHDGVPDLAVANDGSDSVSVVLASGTGGFAPAANYTVGDRPTSVSIEDLNADGRLDLITGNGNSSNLSVLLGHGDGTFLPQANYAAGANPYCVAVSEVNGDGVPDLVASNWGNQSVSVFVGNGNGTFQPRVNYTVGGNPRFVSVGDLNGDGRPDLATANSTHSSISVLLGNGNGTFQPHVDFAVGSDPRSVSIGDLNGDGALDLAVANGNSQRVTVLMGNGDGTFQPQVNYLVEGYPVSLAIGNLDGDDLPDLAVANFLRNQISLMRGIGDGNFAAPEDIGAGGRTYSIGLGDLNADRRPDIAVTNHQLNTVAILLSEYNRGKDFRDTVNTVITTPSISTLVGDGATATATTAVPHLFRDGDPVTISGATPPPFNGTFFVTALSPTEFSYVCPASGTASGANKRATRPHESYPMMQWTLAGLSYLDRTVGRVARPEQHLLPMNTVLSSAATGVLANDIAPPMPISTSPCMTAVPESSPAPGTFASFTPPDVAGHFSYSPPLNFQGTAKFQYKARADLAPNSNQFPACTFPSVLQDSVAVWVSIVVLASAECTPTIDAPPLDADYTESGAASFLVRASSPAGRITFQWRRDGVNLVDRDGATPTESTITGATGPLLTISNMQPADQGVYTCLLRTGCGSATTQGVSLGNPCPADFNGSGTVTAQDIFDFLAAFFTPGSLAADFNHSGAVTSQDIFDFLAAFFTPCQ